MISISKLLDLAYNRNLNIKSGNYIIPPHPLLQKYIAHYTISTPRIKPSSLKEFTLIPDASGCMIFTFDGNQVLQQFWGPTTKTVTVENDDQEIPLRVFVEFLPCGAYQLLNLPLHQLTDKQAYLYDIDKHLSSVMKKIIEQSCSINDLINHLNSFFLNCLSILRQESIVDILASLTNHCDNFLSTKLLSESTFYSERHIARLVQTSLGLNLKSYSKLIRINKAVQLVNSNQMSLTDIAQKLNYYDQSHFIHDFKSVCGVSPSVYIKNMSEFYNEKHKF